MVVPTTRPKEHCHKNKSTAWFGHPVYDEYLQGLQPRLYLLATAAASVTACRILYRARKIGRAGPSYGTTFAPRRRAAWWPQAP